MYYPIKKLFIINLNKNCICFTSNLFYDLLIKFNIRIISINSMNIYFSNIHYFIRKNPKK